MRGHGSCATGGTDCLVARGAQAPTAALDRRRDAVQARAVSWVPISACRGHLGCRRSDARSAIESLNTVGLFELPENLPTRSRCWRDTCWASVVRGEHQSRRFESDAPQHPSRRTGDQASRDSGDMLALAATQVEFQWRRHTGFAPRPSYTARAVGSPAGHLAHRREFLERVR